MTRFVYLCRSQLWAPLLVKIGVTGDVSRRMSQLNARVICAVFGTEELEREFHRRFELTHVRGDHFICSRAILATFEALYWQQSEELRFGERRLILDVRAVDALRGAPMSQSLRRTDAMRPDFDPLELSEGALEKLAVRMPELPHV